MKMEDVTRAVENELPVVHTHNGMAISGYRITGVITRYNKKTGWKYSLELTDKSRSLLIARPEDVNFDKGELKHDKT